MAPTDPNDEGRAIRNSRFPHGTFDPPSRKDPCKIFALVIVTLIVICVAAIARIGHLDDQLDAAAVNYYECMMNSESNVYDYNG